MGDGLAIFENEEAIIGELLPIFLNRLGDKERKILECIYGLGYGREMKIKELTALLSEENMSNVKLLLNKAIHLLKGDKVGLINFIQEEIQTTGSETLSQNFPFKSFPEDGRRIIDTQNKAEGN